MTTNEPDDWYFDGIHHTEPSFDEDIEALLKVCEQIYQSGTNIDRDALRVAIDNVREWQQHYHDPKGNGWVGNDGRP